MQTCLLPGSQDLSRALSLKQMSQEEAIISHNPKITRKLSNSSKTEWKENPGGLGILIYAGSIENLLCARVISTMEIHKASI